MSADPVVGIATILGNYVPLSSWNQWLISYGTRPADRMPEKFHRHVIVSLLQETTRHYKREDYRRMNGEILQLKQIFNGRGLVQTLRRFGQTLLIREGSGDR